MDAQQQSERGLAQLAVRQARRAFAVPSVRYASAGFVLGVLAMRRLGRLTGRARRWTWQGAAVEAVTLAIALREIGTELDAYGAEREIGSRRARAMIDARGEDRAAGRGAITTGTGV